MKPFTVEGDDHQLRKAKWASLLKDSAFYFDKPTLQQERDMRFKLQQRYDDLFEEAWRPPLQNRRELVLWSCQKQNEFLEGKGAAEDQLDDCSNYNALLRKYGPNYDLLKHKLGYVRGLFD